MPVKRKRRLTMEVVNGKCIICEEINHVLASSNKNGFLELLKNFNIVTKEQSHMFSSLYKLQSICVTCAYGLNCCTINVDIIKDRPTNKNRRRINKCCSVCFDDDNVILCTSKLKCETADYLDAVKAGIKVDAKRLCINCYYCVTIRNKLAIAVKKLMGPADSENSEINSERKTSNKKNVVRYSKSFNKRKRILNSKTASRAASVLDSPSTDSEISSRGNKRRRLSALNETLLKKTSKREANEALDRILAHISTVDGESNERNLNLDVKVTKDTRMMFDVSYVQCETIENINQSESNIRNYAMRKRQKIELEVIEILSDQSIESIAPTRTSVRNKKRKYYAPPKRKINKRTSKFTCKECGRKFSSMYQQKLHEFEHESSKVDGKISKLTRKKAVIKEHDNTDSEGKQKSEQSVSDSSNNQKKNIKRSTRSQRDKERSKVTISNKKDSNENKYKSSASKVKILKRSNNNSGTESEESENSETDTNDSSSLKKKANKRVSKNIETDNSGTENEEKSENSEPDKDDSIKSKKETSSLKKNANKKVSKNIETDNSGTKNEEKSENSETDKDDSIKSKRETSSLKKKANKRVSKNIKSDNSGTENEKKSEHSETDNDDSIKSKRETSSLKRKANKKVPKNKDDSETDCEEKSEHSETDNDNSKKSKEKTSSLRKKGNRVSKNKAEDNSGTENEEKSEHSETDNDDAKQSKGNTSILQKIDKTISKNKGDNSGTDNEEKSEQSETDNSKKSKGNTSSLKIEGNRVSKNKAEDNSGTVNEEKSEHSETDDNNSEESKGNTSLIENKTNTASKLNADEDNSGIEDAENSEHSEIDNGKTEISKGKAYSMKKGTNSKNKSDDDENNPGTESEKKTENEKSEIPHSATDKPNSKVAKNKSDKKDNSESVTEDKTEYSESDKIEHAKQEVSLIKQHNKSIAIDSSDEPSDIDNKNNTSKDNESPKRDNTNEEVDLNEENKKPNEDSVYTPQDEENNKAIDLVSKHDQSSDIIAVPSDEEITETDKALNNDNLSQNSDEGDTTNTVIDDTDKDDEETQSKEDDLLFLNVEDAGIQPKVENDDTASDTTEILQRSPNVEEEDSPVLSSKDAVQHGDSELESLRLSSASLSQEIIEKSTQLEENLKQSIAKNNPADFNFVEKILENLGAMAIGNKERTFKIQLNSAKDNS